MQIFHMQGYQAASAAGIIRYLKAKQSQHSIDSCKRGLTPDEIAETAPHFTVEVQILHGADHSSMKAFTLVGEQPHHSTPGHCGVELEDLGIRLLRLRVWVARRNQPASLGRL